LINFIYSHRAFLLRSWSCN